MRVRSAALAVAAAVALAACSGGDDPVPAADTSGSVVGATAAVAGEPSGWNPHTASDRSDALAALSQLIYPSAFTVSAVGEPALNDAVLDSAEVTSEDPFTVRYRIRDDAEWSDGTPISAADFTFLWERHTDPEADVSERTGYELIEAVGPAGAQGEEGDEAGDPRLVEVVFSEPYGEWRRLFTHLLPAHEVADVAGWNESLDGDRFPRVTAGPYRVLELSPGNRVTLVADGRYGGPAPLTEKIEVRFGIEPVDLPAALENGEVDVVEAPAQLDLVDRIERLAPEITVRIGFGYAWEHLEFNLRHPDLADHAVRRAVALAVDRTEVVARTVRHLDNRAERLDHRIFVNHMARYRPQAGEYGQPNVEGARAALAAAGYAAGPDGVFAKDGRRLSLRLSTSGGDALREDVQTVIAEHLARAGIEAVAANDEGQAVLSRFFPSTGRLADQDFDIGLFAWDASPFPHRNHRLYESDGRSVGFNPSGYRSAAVTDLFDRAAHEIDDEARTELYHQIDQVLWQDLPSLPVHARPLALAHRSALQGVEHHPLYGPLASAPRWRMAPDAS